MRDVSSPPAAYSEKNVSRTRRLGLSRLLSTNATACQTPSAGSPESTGMVSDGLSRVGSRWSAGCQP